MGINDAKVPIITRPPRPLPDDPLVGEQMPPPGPPYTAFAGGDPYPRWFTWLFCTLLGGVIVAVVLALVLQ